MLVRRSISVLNHGYSVEVPDECPICHRHSQIELVKSDNINGVANVALVARCGYSECRSYFICTYGPRPSSTLLSVQPRRPDPTNFSSAIAQMSPVFVQVFRQAEEAHASGLTQVAGPGFRKAFEYLIKDYAKANAPESAKDIDSAFSGTVVDKFVPDARIQAVAKRCLWLGNDESHYLKKWEDHDVSDLINLIKLTVHWIDIEQLSKQYISEMPEGK